MAKKELKQLNTLFETITYKYQLKHFRNELEANTIELRTTKKYIAIIALCFVVMVIMFFYFWLSGTFHNAIYDMFMRPR